MSKSLSYLAIGLVAFVAGGLMSHLITRAEGPKDEPQVPQVQQTTTRTFAIEGMTCQGCADTITAALKQIPGVHSAKVSLQGKQAAVVADESDVPDDKVLGAIAAAGYKGTTTAMASQVPVLVNITRGKDDLHAVSMALGLAQSALKDGRKATVFLNVDAAAFSAKDLGDDVKFADFPPVKTMLADFMAAGGQVLVCGHCAHVAELEPDNVTDGMKLLNQGELFGLLAPGTVVFSY